MNRPHLLITGKYYSEWSTAHRPFQGMFPAAVETDDFFYSGMIPDPSWQSAYQNVRLISWQTNTNRWDCCTSTRLSNCLVENAVQENSTSFRWIDNDRLENGINCSTLTQLQNNSLDEKLRDYCCARKEDIYFKYYQVAAGARELKAIYILPN